MANRKESRSHVLLSDAPLKRDRLSSFKGGWFIGDFTPSLYRTTAVEVGYKIHPQGSSWPRHYQKTVTEYNLLTHGTMQIGSQIFGSGAIFSVPPLRPVKPTFLTDCEVLVVKIPSRPHDKVLLSR